MTTQQPTLELLLARLSPRVSSLYASNATARFVVDLVLMMLGFLMFSKFLRVVTVLPEADYFEWSIVWGLVTHHPVYILTGLSILGVLIRYGALADRWADIGHGSVLRLCIGLLAVLLAWPYVLYDYNYYLDQSHLLDRVLLALLAGLIVWRPVFVIGFLLVQMTIMWQFLQPTLGGSLFAHKLQVSYPLILFAAALGVHAITQRFPTRAFMLLLLTMVAAAYWEAARAKYVLDWALTNELHLILPAAYNHGWLGGWSAETIASISRAIAPLDLPLQVIVMVLEAASLVILWNRRLAVTLLTGLIAFHIGVFAFYGFLFWTWIALDVVVVILLLQLQPDIFGLRMILLSAPLILVGTYWTHAPSLGWLDTRLGYTYRVEALTAEGKWQQLDPAYFGPYQDTFTMTGFSYLSPSALTGPYAVSHDPELAARLREPLSLTELVALEKSAPTSPNPARVVRFEEFIRTFVRNRNRNGHLWRWTELVEPPGQFLHTGSRGVAELEDIEEVVVIEVTSFTENAGPRVLREVEVSRIMIGGTP